MPFLPLSGGKGFLFFYWVCGGCKKSSPDRTEPPFFFTLTMSCGGLWLQPLGTGHDLGRKTFRSRHDLSSYVALPVHTGITWKMSLPRACHSSSSSCLFSLALKVFDVARVSTLAAVASSSSSPKDAANLTFATTTTKQQSVLFKIYGAYTFQAKFVRYILRRSRKFRTRVSKGETITFPVPRPRSFSRQSEDTLTRLLSSRSH